MKMLKLFMWGYQPHFQHGLERLAKKVLEAIGFVAEPQAFLVGVRKPGPADPNPVCIEPEFETWPLSLFTGVREDIEIAYPKHDLQTMLYTHAQSMEEKPENIRRDVVRTEVLKRLKAFDDEFGVVSFCGWPRLVNDYYVVPVIQVLQAAVNNYPSLRTDVLYQGRYRPSKSFIHVCLGEVLDSATSELEATEPGRGDFTQSAEDVARRAADHFLRTPLLATARDGKMEEAFALPLFRSLNAVSSHMYEDTAGIGRLLLVNPDNPNVEYTLRFPKPIPFRDTRWIRKLLQMSVGANSVVANGGGIWGLGTLKNYDVQAENAYWIDFVGHYQWNLRIDSRVLFQSRLGEPTLLTEPISEDRFVDNYRRILDGATDAQARNAWRIMQAAIQEPRGSMIVFAGDAEAEAKRLSQQGMAVVPAQLTDELFASASRIDGSILCDPEGVCHSMGVILDGVANENCLPSRGSRYNSAVRYVLNGMAPRIAVVKSEDGELDVIPLLMAQMSRKKFTDAIDALEKANGDNYYKPRLFLDDHRFYALPEDCARINAALDRIDAFPREVGLIHLHTTRFTPHPAMQPSYFLP